MDHENAIAEEENSSPSLLQVDPAFLRKILGRKSLNASSMRMFYNENLSAVPFEWELQPGTPKHPQAETIPPLKPPPGFLSQTMEKPKFASPTPSHARMSCFIWTTRRSKKGNNKKAKSHHEGEASEGEKSPEILESSDDNVDPKPSSDHSRSSSSSSSFSTSSSSSSSSLRGLAKGFWVKMSF